MFGRRISKDDRDRGYLMKRLLPSAAEVTLPVKKTWAINGKALDQGDHGDCVGMAWCNFLRAAPVRSAGDVTLAEDIYDQAIVLDEFDDNDVDPDRQIGTSIRGGAEAVMKIGRLKSYLWAFELQPAVEWVLTQGPVVLGVNWYTGMMKPDKDGLVKINPRDRVEGGHAILWRGADTKRALALLSNSWGDDWGKSGECYISFRDVERLIHEDGAECCTAVQKRLGAKAI